MDECDEHGRGKRSGWFDFGQTIFQQLSAGRLVGGHVMDGLGMYVQIHKVYLS